MKQKLSKFTEFADNLFPHEVYYLSGIENFQTSENKGIFDIIQYNLNHRAEPKPFDESIDKRKYSNLKKWMQEKLAEADVDQQLLFIQELEAKVLLDQVDKQTDREIQKWLQRGVPTHYYFRKIYELAQHYEHFLLIRLREHAGTKVGEYLNQYRENFEQSQEVFNKLQQATADITYEYKNRTETHRGWEEFLTNVVYSENMDGMNQYSAFIRLSLLYSNHGEYHKMVDLYNYIDDRFKEGKFNSKRILANYYANRLLYMSKYSSLDEAEQYGYLSIKYKNADYLFYLTNLAAVLLRQGKSEVALKLLRDAFPELRQTNSLHNKNGFIAFYIKCMVDIGRVKEAEAFADSFLKAYPKQVLSGRWHLFFVAYFRSLMIQEKYSRLLYLDNHYKIEAKDKANRSSHSYLPTISWYISLAKFVERGGDPDQLLQEMKEAIVGIEMVGKRAERIERIYDEISVVAPQVFKKGKSALFDELLSV